MEGPPEPPLVPISADSARASRLHIGVTVPLLAIAVTTYGLRMYARVKPVWRIGWEDYCITIGVALAIVDFGFLIPEQFTQESFISQEAALWAVKYASLAIPVWGIAMMFIKLSITMLLLKIPIGTWWRVCCWLMVLLQVAYGVGNTFFILLQCHPIEAMWDPAVLVHRGSCLSLSAVVIASNVGAGVNISTDILLSLAPSVFLWRLRRPFREKVLVGVLMSLGTVASISSIVKSTFVKQFPTASDPWAVAIRIATWTALEQLLAITAGCAPYLKPLLQSTLHKFGIILLDTEVTASSFRQSVREEIWIPNNEAVPGVREPPECEKRDIPSRRESQPALILPSKRESVVYMRPRDSPV